MLHTAPVQLAQRCAEEALDHKGEVVLHYICTLPQIHGLASRAQKRINRYYRHLEQSLQRACRTRLLPQATVAAQLAHANALPFTPLEGALDWETTYLSDTLWSLSWTWRVTDGRTPLAYHWQGEVWDLNTGLPCSLDRFAPQKQRRSTRILTQARRAAKEQKRLGPGRRGRRLSFTITDTELLCFWPTVLNSRRREDFFRFSLPFSPEDLCIC